METDISDVKINIAHAYFNSVSDNKKRCTTSIIFI